MWPSRKKENKGIKLAPGESMEIGFAASWRRDRDEVLIMTDDGPIVLDGKNELFIEISADNIDPIKVQVVPDFKKKTINLVEIIDPNAEKKFPDKDGPSLAFAGSTIIKERCMTISDYLKNWDQNMERSEKVVKRSKIIRNIFIPVNVILFFWNLYLFMTNSDMFRYVNLILAILCIYMIYYIWNSHKKLYRYYLEYKDLREKSFGVVKER
jgi:hypothetical protein